MKKDLRKAVIAGNWKMNKTPAEAKALIEEMKPLVAGADCDVVLCVPFIDIPAAIEAAAGSNIKIGAENVHFKSSGAYTGEISAEMLKEAGVEYVVVGHSERRTYFNETNHMVNKRILTALRHNIKPILCIGETLKEREALKTYAVLKRQLTSALKGLDSALVKKVIIAYEPVWAIGTGKVPTNQEIEDTIAFIKNIVNMIVVLDEEGNYNELKDLEEEDKDSFLSNDEFESSV